MKNHELLFVGSTNNCSIQCESPAKKTSFSTLLSFVELGTACKKNENPNTS